MGAKDAWRQENVFNGKPGLLLVWSLGNEPIVLT